MIRTIVSRSLLRAQPARALQTRARAYATTVASTADLLKSSSSAGGQATARPKVKRFWEKANVRSDENGHLICLDSRPIKTSAGNNLVVPKEKTVLAHLIVKEWATLPSLAIKPHSLPLTSLAARAVDIEQVSDHDSDAEFIVDGLLPYLDTDTMLILAPTSEYHGALRQDQEKTYRPIIAWTEEFFGGVRLNVSDGDHGLTGNMQDEAVKARAKAWALSLTPWELTAFERAVLGGKSFLAGMQLVLRRMSTADIAEAVTLEVTHQMRRWGEVEDSHDVDWADLRRQLGSAAVLVIN
ncbi:uncharacterized protein V1510DRAFT_415356 [Dipodascopsis tothii]|uniref:uncharacterized protein n=1 Tax=Dipodascopsis tothii TaxID=44089 RepID=UPI0034CD4731